MTPPNPFENSLLSLLIVFALLLSNLAGLGPLERAAAQEPQNSQSPMAARIETVIPELEAAIARGMEAFDAPGLAVGIVAGGRLVYAKGFGVRSKASRLPVDPRTVFQIGSATKAFLATTMAIAVDHGKLRWDDRVVDLNPSFQLVANLSLEFLQERVARAIAH